RHVRPNTTNTGEHCSCVRYVRHRQSSAKLAPSITTNSVEALCEAEFVSKDQTETAPNGAQAPMVDSGKKRRASDYVELAARMRVTARYSDPCAADDLRLADEWEAQARTKQLPSTRTEIGAGGELIDREKVGSHLVDTVAHPDYVTAEASSDRLALASQAGSLSLALDAADTIQAQD